MSRRKAIPLSPFDRHLLRTAGRIVPSADREEWRRSWYAELWHKRNRDHAAVLSTAWSTADLSAGLVLDALWLRIESCRRSVHGTARLCVVSLSGLCLLAVLLGIALHGSLSAFFASFSGQIVRFLTAAPLVSLVTLAVAPSRPVEQRPPRRRAPRLRRQIFFAVKATLILLLTLLMSVNCCQPLSQPFPLITEFLEMLLFVFFALLGLRWNFQDQEQRCKDCLRTLSAPARVGRPSHNLLEWNGTEMTCVRGHGRLKIPELETSWCRSGMWMSHRLATSEVEISPPE